MSLRGAQRRAAAQPFATKERYGCGVPLAGIAGIAGAISCRHFRLYTNPFVRAVCRLRGRHAESSCPTILERTLAVGRDDSARRWRNHRLRTNPQPEIATPSVRTGFAMTKQITYDVIARSAATRGCAAVREERALRMRRTPCGYCGCNLMQALPTVYKPVRPYRLPLTRSARRGRRALRL